MNILRNKKLFIGFIILFLVLSLILLYPLLTQEENTFSVLGGIVALNVKDIDIHEYHSDSSFNYYLTKSNEGYEPIKLMMENDGWSFKEQLGSGFLFEKSTDDKQTLTVVTTQFSRYYRLWTVPQTAN